ncbi:hypothetical protein [Ruegeria sp. HKCCA4633]|uniref:hypothetical protein n=1 Tax=Ruegeria sp. HKCCA4633 TaxID=2682983 RepID=UPI001488EE2A|nr:hypothetical protein [Ruegeria sp. HKCCA4633]
MVDIAATISALTGSLEVIKAIRDTNHAYDKNELKAQMADLYGNLADVKMALSDAHMELKERDQKIKELTEHAELQGSLITINGYKYDDKDGRPVGLPYCPQCEVAENKLYRLTLLSDTRSRCTNCKNGFPVAADGNVHPEKTNT